MNADGCGTAFNELTLKSQNRLQHPTVINTYNLSQTIL